MKLLLCSIVSHGRLVNKKKTFVMRFLQRFKAVIVLNVNVAIVFIR